MTKMKILDARAISRRRIREEDAQASSNRRIQDESARKKHGRAPVEAAALERGELQSSAPVEEMRPMRGRAPIARSGVDWRGAIALGVHDPVREVELPHGENLIKNTV